VYIILGATHPHIKRREGETYRLALERLARERGVAGHVIFFNRFVSLEELIEFIGAADIYITPYLNREQIVSGTLAYSLGAGKAVISTPYWYAEELLAEERGVLVPFRDAPALAERVNDLLGNEAKRHAMRKRAYLFGREMIWSRVAQRYMESFEWARSERRRYIHSGFTVKALDQRPAELPPLKLVSTTTRSTAYPTVEATSWRACSIIASTSSSLRPTLCSALRAACVRRACGQGLHNRSPPAGHRGHRAFAFVFGSKTRGIEQARRVVDRFGDRRLL